MAALLLSRFALFATTCALPACATPPNEAHQRQAESQPGRAQKQPLRFQPGVEIDWERRTVRVSGRVVLRGGPLEFFACLHSKEHESILRLEAAGTHMFMAMGLIGLMPGHPPLIDEKTGLFGPAAGDLVDVRVEWAEQDKRRSAAAFDWLRETGGGQTPIARPWVFAGSVVGADKTLLCDRSGTAIAVVDQADSLLTLSRNYDDADAELWAAANTERIPPVGTAVHLVLSAARPMPRFDARVDHLGELHFAQRIVAPADLADLILLARRIEPRRVQEIRFDGTLRSDRRRFLATLRAAGVGEEAIRIVKPGGAASSRPASRRTSKKSPR